MCDTSVSIDGLWMLRAMSSEDGRKHVCLTVSMSSEVMSPSIGWLVRFTVRVAGGFHVWYVVVGQILISILLSRVGVRHSSFEWSIDVDDRE